MGWAGGGAELERAERSSRRRMADGGDGEQDRAEQSEREREEKTEEVAHRRRRKSSESRKKAWGRRRNGDDSREGRHHDEEDNELSTGVASDFTGDARMRRMVGFWGKDCFRDSQTRSLPTGSLYFCVELP